MPRPPHKVAPQDRRRVGSEAEFPPTLLERLIAVIKRWITTANAPVKVGVLVSLVGVGLLTREASIRGFVTLTIEMRLVAVAFFGLVLLGLGWRQRARQPVYGLSLQGGGIAVLYLTTFAAYARYDLLPAVVALVAVVAITVGAGALAVVQRSLSLALLGLIGGYLAPLLAYRWPEDHLAVFSFYAVLSVAVISGARPTLDVGSLWIVPLVFGTPFIGIALQSILVGARVTRWPGLDAAGLVMLPVLGSWLGLAIAVEAHPVAGFGWAAWPIALAVTPTYVAYVRVCEDAWPHFGTAVHCGGYWAVAVLVGVETYWRIALAAMVAGVVRANRGIWIAGAAWMALVVAKLFLVDLASLTALSRVISFIGVGVLLLIVGRFAPVVPAAKSESSKD